MFEAYRKHLSEKASSVYLVRALELMAQGPFSCSSIVILYCYLISFFYPSSPTFTLNKATFATVYFS